MSNKTNFNWRGFLWLMVTLGAVGVIAIVKFPGPENELRGTCWVIMIMLALHMAHMWTMPTRR